MDRLQSYLVEKILIQIRQCPKRGNENSGHEKNEHEKIGREKKANIVQKGGAQLTQERFREPSPS